MKRIIIFLVITLSLSASAQQKIEKLLYNGEIKAGYVSLFLDDGEIVHFHKSDDTLLAKVKNAFNNLAIIETVKISLNTESADIIADINIISVPRQVVRTESTTQTRVRPANTRNESFQIDLRDPNAYGKVTRLSSYSDAQNIMDKFNGDTHKDSQCYNRATMWSYEAQVKSKIDLGKIWIFFTQKYISEYNYKWWFHIAPYTNVNENKYILDRGFTMVPYTVKNWKNIFVKSGASCPVIKDYRQYEDNQQTQDCYLIFSNQYYWQPYHLENLAKRGQAQKSYSSTDFRITYKDALQEKWNGTIPTPTVAPDEPTPDVGESSLKIGETVISTTGVRGVVTKLYTQRTIVDIKYDGYRQPMTQSVKDLAVLYGSSRGFYVGDTIFTKARSIRGKVIGVFQDGRLSIKFKRTKYYVTQHPNQLVKY